MQTIEDRDLVKKAPGFWEFRILSASCKMISLSLSLFLSAVPASWPVPIALAASIAKLYLAAMPHTRQSDYCGVYTAVMRDNQH